MQQIHFHIRSVAQKMFKREFLVHVIAFAVEPEGKLMKKSKGNVFFMTEEKLSRDFLQA